ncbi:MAG: cardiolipin synthase [Clostridia bacterium]|nr:cardiolipin synthase [Clostridia bacterium]
MSLFAFISLLVILTNIFFVVIMIFVERKKPNVIISWLVVLTFLPIIGFLIYLLVGNGLSYKTTRMIKKMKIHRKEYVEFVKKQKQLFSQLSEDQSSDFILFNLNNSNSAYFSNNLISVYTSGEEKIEALKKDLEKAKHSINMLYYIFADDIVGHEIMNILVKKAKEGVKVNLIYDSLGCIRTKKSFFKNLKDAGGEVAEFFPPIFFRYLNFKANYRNHRKIVVIDGNIGYTGGINIRDDHMGRKKRLSPWRDTHIRITGKAVYSLQIAFFNDWRYCRNIKTSMDNLLKEGYFPRIYSHGQIGAQIITSGPDVAVQPIKEALIKMILSAKHKIRIQTPYFIPDDFMIGALLIAQKSGVKIEIMIPSKPDKKFVFNATLSYVKDLLPTGIKFYSYNGFMHSKTMIVDDKIVSIGTCNLDNRSFSLNFEINTFLFNKEFARKSNDIFTNDLQNCKQIDTRYFTTKPWVNRVSQAFFKLFSPLL